MTDGAAATLIWKGNEGVRFICFFFNPLYVRDVHVDVRKAAFRKHFFFCRVEYLDFFNRFFYSLFCLFGLICFLFSFWLNILLFWCMVFLWSGFVWILILNWIEDYLEILFNEEIPGAFFYSLRLFLSSFLPELSKLKMLMINTRRKILNSAIYVILNNIFFLRLLFFKRRWYDMIWYDFIV